MNKIEEALVRAAEKILQEAGWSVTSEQVDGKVLFTCSADGAETQELLGSVGQLVSMAKRCRPEYYPVQAIEADMDELERFVADIADVKFDGKGEEWKARIVTEDAIVKIDGTFSDLGFTSADLVCYAQANEGYAVSSAGEGYRVVRNKDNWNHLMQMERLLTAKEIVAGEDAKHSRPPAGLGDEVAARVRAEMAAVAATAPPAAPTRAKRSDTVKVIVVVTSASRDHKKIVYCKDETVSVEPLAEGWTPRKVIETMTGRGWKARVILPARGQHGGMIALVNPQ